MIGRLAKEYHVLPHVVDQNATTYDLMIYDVLATYENYQRNKNDPQAMNIPEEELLAILEKNRG